MFFAKLLKCVIMKMEFDMILTTKCVMDCVSPNKPWFQFGKHSDGYLHMGISTMKFLEQCNFSHFHSLFIVIYIHTFGYMLSQNILFV